MLVPSQIFKTNMTMILPLSRPNTNKTAALEQAHGKSTKQSCLLATELTLSAELSLRVREKSWGFFLRRENEILLIAKLRNGKSILDLLCWLRILRGKKSTLNIWGRTKPLELMPWEKWEKMERFAVKISINNWNTELDFRGPSVF